MTLLLPLKHIPLLSSLLLATSLLASTKTPDSPPKFALNSAGLIAVTPEGSRFVREVISKQITLRVRKVKKSEIPKWITEFVRLSDKKAQKRSDFTPANNMLNHLLLTDQILSELLTDSTNDSDSFISESDRVPDKSKELIFSYVKDLNKKLGESELVEKRSLADFQKLIEFYDRSLKETLN